MPSVYSNSKSNKNEIGKIDAFGTPNAPKGWLKCNGAEISRTAYAKLFAVIGENFGAGDGVNTFNLPDFRGEFIRGFDDGRGIDSGRVFGSSQAHAIESHIHGLAASNGTNHGFISKFATVEDYNAGYTKNSYAAGDGETRPVNSTALICIKYQ